VRGGRRGGARPAGLQAARADLEADQDSSSPGLDPCSSAQAFDAAFTLANESRSGTVDEAEFLSLVALLKCGKVHGLASGGGGLLAGWFAKREQGRSQHAATSPLPAPAREAVAVFADDAQPVRSGFLRVSGGQGRLELQRFFAAGSRPRRVLHAARLGPLAARGGRLGRCDWRGER
jgi:hypothetical protein